MSKDKKNISENSVKTSSWFGYLTNVAMSATGGYIFGGTKGLVSATVSTALDESLIKHNYTNQHYFSKALLNTALVVPGVQMLTDIFPEYWMTIYGIGGCAIAGSTYFSKDPLNTHDKIDGIVNAVTPLVELLDKDKIISYDELNRISEKYKTSSFEAAKIVFNDLYYISQNPIINTIAKTNALKLIDTLINSSFVKYVGNNGTTLLAVSLLAQNSPTVKVQEIVYQGFKISLLWFGKNIVSSAINFANSHLSDNLKKTINQKSIEEILLNKDYSNKILSMKNSDEITKTLSNDLNTLQFYSSFQIQNLITNRITDFVTLRDVVSTAPESLIISQLYGMLQSKIRDKVAKSTIENSKESQLIESDILEIVYDLSNNYTKAVLIKSTDLIRDKYTDILEKNGNSQTKQKFTENVSQTITSLMDNLKTLFDTSYYSYKVIYGQLKVEQLPILKSWIDSSSPLLNGSDRFNVTFDSSTIAQKRISDLLKVIHNPIESIINRTSNDKNKIFFKNYKLTIKTKEDEESQGLLKINYLGFSKNICAISGESGLGKTSLIKDLMQCLRKPLNSTGEISLPSINGKDASILFVDQHLYIPAKVTLFEAITLKSTSSLKESDRKLLKQKIIDLFKEIRIDQLASSDKGLINELDNPDYDTDSLSGGQKKKIGIIRAIIAKPDILIADEIFVGLDPKSIFSVQKLFKKYLPNTKLLIVDHYAKNNNYDSFYEEQVTLLKDSQKIEELGNIVFENSVEIIGDTI
jgi:ABC-type multidrug transport system ATPase subunit